MPQSLNNIDIEVLKHRLATEDVRDIADELGVSVLLLAAFCRREKIDWPGVPRSPRQKSEKSSVESARLEGTPTRRATKRLSGQPYQPPSDPPAIPLPSKGERSVLVSREQLYELVWYHSTLQLSKAWGISDVALGKVCKANDVPKPALGDWTRMQHGHRVHRPPLPAREGHDRIRLSVYIPTQEQIVRQQKRKAELQSLETVPVSELLTDPHRIVARVQKALRRAKPDSRGLVTPSGKGVMPLSIGPESIDRSLLFLDAFIKSCESLGMKVEILIEERQNESGYYDPSLGKTVYFKPTYTNMPKVHVDGESFTFYLDERTRRLPKQMTDEARKRRESKGYFLSQPYDYVPSGMLCFHLEKGSFRDHQRWQDGKRWRIEEGIGEMVQRLRELAREVKQRRVEEAEAKERAAIAEERRMELERLRAVEQKRGKKLYCDVRAWRYATDAREFISLVREKLAEAPLESRSAIEQWLAWAERHVRRIDPLADASPTLEKYDDSRGYASSAYRSSSSYSSGYGSSQASPFPFWLEWRL